MGRGIAYSFAVAGVDTDVVDVNHDTAIGAVAAIAQLATGAVERGRLSDDDAAAVRHRLNPCSFDDLDGRIDIIVEAVPEDPDLKVDVLRRAESLAPTMLATNTSSIPISSMAKSLTAPDRFVGLHFFNPVWSMRLIEVVVGAETSPATVAFAERTARLLDKEPIVVNDSPGFATSRLGVVLGLEAIRMVGEGVADPAVIDRAMELGYGHPMGPLRLTDLVGLDVRLSIAQQLASTLGARFSPPALLVEKVAAGELGKKTGRGFYAWS